MSAAGAAAILHAGPVSAVWRYELRRRRAARALLITLTLLAILAVCAWQAGGQLGAQARYNAGAGALAQAYVAYAAAAAVLLPAAAALAGALAIPTAGEAASIEAALATHIRPGHMLAGRLLARSSPVLAALCASCVYWCLAAIMLRLPGGAAAVLASHAVIASAALMVSGVAALLASRTRPGSFPVLGALAALAWLGLLAAAIVLANPLVDRMNDPVQVIEGALLVNPVVAAATPAHADLLRSRWVYNLTDAPDYEFAYPPAAASALLFAGAGAVLLLAASARLKRAYL